MWIVVTMTVIAITVALITVALGFEMLRRIKELEDEVDMINVMIDVFLKNHAIDINQLKNTITSHIQSSSGSGIVAPPENSVFNQEVIEGLNDLLEKVYLETDKQSTPDKEPKEKEFPSRMIRLDGNKD